MLGWGVMSWNARRMSQVEVEVEKMWGAGDILSLTLSPPRGTRGVISVVSGPGQDRTQLRTSRVLCPRQGGGERAPGTALRVHFQLFHHWRLIGPGVKNTWDCALIGGGSPGSGLTTSPLTSHVTSTPPCWIGSLLSCADEWNSVVIIFETSGENESK